jgi:tRNA (adenine22-N1)-methyltransferase
MRLLSLRPRLLAVASFIRPDDRVLDIGTDHARLPVYLIQQGLCASVTATDISKGPLTRALRTIKTHRLDKKITLLQTDGAEGISSADYDAVVIAGMGGDTIISIVERSPWLLDKRLVLQPQTRISDFSGMLNNLFHKVSSRTMTSSTEIKSVMRSEGFRQYRIFSWEVIDH